MRSVRLVLLLLIALAPSLRAQDGGGLHVRLNIPEQVVRVYDGARLLKTYPVSVGLPGHDTPDGDFTIQRAEWNPWWRPPAREWARDDKVTPPGPNNPMGRVKLFFAPYYYLHGTPHEKDLGTPASHGCVRMRNTDVIELATLLHERANPTVPPSEIRAILSRPRNTRNVGFRTPVPLSIRYEPIVVENGELRIYPDVYKRGRIHTEAVFQALLAAGYDAAAVDRAAVRDVLTRARNGRGVVVVDLGEGLGVRRAAAR